METEDIGYKDKVVRAARLRAVVIAYFNKHPAKRLTLKELFDEGGELHSTIMELGYNKGSLFYHMKHMVLNKQLSGAQEGHKAEWVYFKHDPTIKTAKGKKRVGGVTSDAVDLPPLYATPAALKRMQSEYPSNTNHAAPMLDTTFVEFNVAGTTLMLGSDVNLWIGKDGSGKLKVFVN